MKTINRRRFLTLAGAGSVAAATGVGGVATQALAARRPNVLTFRALAGLPAKPLPSYATLIMEGHVDLARRTGVLTTTLFAGAPQDMSDVALLGMSRVMRVVDVREQSGRVRITAVVDDRAQLRKGESAVVRVFLDLRRGTVSTRFISTPVTLRLAP